MRFNILSLLEGSKKLWTIRRPRASVENVVMVPVPIWILCPNSASQPFAYSSARVMITGW